MKKIEENKTVKIIEDYTNNFSSNLENKEEYERLRHIVRNEDPFLATGKIIDNLIDYLVEHDNLEDAKHICKYYKLDKI
jgi:hypothetical protein